MKFFDAITFGCMLGTAPVMADLEAFKADLKEKAVGLEGFIFDDLCATICYFTSTCRNDPQSHGSYCKIANTPNTCFGLYFQFNILRPFCFQPNDPNCPVCDYVSSPLFFLGTIPCNLWRFPRCLYWSRSRKDGYSRKNDWGNYRTSSGCTTYLGCHSTWGGTWAIQSWTERKSCWHEWIRFRWLLCNSLLLHVNLS